MIKRYSRIALMDKILLFILKLSILERVGVKKYSGKNFPFQMQFFFYTGAMRWNFSMFSSPKGKWDSSSFNIINLEGLMIFKDADQLSFWLYARQGNQQSLPLVSFESR
jgi:hypothetical protein